MKKADLKADVCLDPWREMKPILTAKEHYDRLAQMGNDVDDPPEALEYMSRWDGPPFWNAVGDSKGKDILEIGVGTPASRAGY